MFLYGKALIMTTTKCKEQKKWSRDEVEKLVIVKKKTRKLMFESEIIISQNYLNVNVFTQFYSFKDLFKSFLKCNKWYIDI